MTTTENYGLKKPDGSDYASVGDINDNMDAIDKELKSQSAHADRMDNPHGVTKSQVGWEMFRTLRPMTRRQHIPLLQPLRRLSPVRS